eukprot:CAMPEP_0119300978 /NCGR_PEP_ID=MMETSP1333-20130426/2857_1 /TAXON_ID=418940 /ORGANISM="Scyphosphaera apsteinii, Strain RCC1455" /LENGTH=290 /DNA_ID=CAMNT_0007302935 /DNA_START=261 /DNA_END=1130 /DNA_ORIENTATION=-
MQPCEVLYNLTSGCPKPGTKPQWLHLPSLAKRRVLLVGDSVSMQLKSWFACRTKSTVVCLEAKQFSFFNRSILDSTKADTVWLMFGPWYIAGNSSADTEEAALNYITYHVPEMLMDLQAWLDQKSGRIGIFSSPPVQHWRGSSGGFTRDVFKKCMKQVHEQIAIGNSTQSQKVIRNLCSNGIAGSPTSQFFSSIEHDILKQVWKAASNISAKSSLLFFPLTELTMTLSPELQHPGWVDRLGGTCDCTHYCYTAHTWDKVILRLDDYVRLATDTIGARAYVGHCPDRTSFW